MTAKYQIILLILLLSVDINAQWSNVSLITKIGSANYDLLISIGLNSDSDWWGNGLQSSFGLEYKLSESWSLQGLLLYSRHSLINNYPLKIEQQNPGIRLFDVMCYMKWNINFIYIKIGRAHV